jgi:hypothetical protein
VTLSTVTVAFHSAPTALRTVGGCCGRAVEDDGVQVS